MRITEITRAEILDFLLDRAAPFHGKRDLITFLSQVWPLDKMPSTDRRCANAAEDIHLHAVTFPEDLPPRRMLEERLELPAAPDEVFLRFLEECVHPMTLRGAEDRDSLPTKLNELLAPDGFRLASVAVISGRPVYKAVEVANAAAPIAPIGQDDQFALDDEVGRGAFGTVYVGQDLKLGRRVAVKIIRSSGERVLSALEQAKVLARANHPNVVSVYSVTKIMDPETHEARDAIVMEFVDGKRLSECLKEAALSIEEARRIGNEIIDGLEHLHLQGLTHEDLHEDNVLVSSAGSKLIDPMYLSTLANLSSDAKGARIRRDLVNLRDLLGALLNKAQVEPKRQTEFDALPGRNGTIQDIRKRFDLVFADSDPSEIEQLMADIRQEMEPDGYKVTLEEDTISFVNEREDYFNSMSVRVLLEMARDNRLVWFLRSGIFVR